MFQEIKDKYEHLMKSSSHMWANGNFSFYRLGIFITSYKGQKRILNFIWKVIRYIFRKIFGIKPDRTPDYDLWQKKYFPSNEVLNEYALESKNFEFRPLVSVILPVYNPPVKFLTQAIQSVIDQVYDNWELCIADDCSTNAAVKSILEDFAKQDARVKIIFRKENGHISASSNSALSIATGEYVALLDHDDLLSPDALLHNVKILNETKLIDLIYSDEDKVDEKGEHMDPHFKPDWCPDNFLSRNYLGHLVVIRKSLVDKVGGFRIGFEGSQDYDLLLRVTELTDRIHHIPLVLYHWRMHSASTSVNEEAKPYAFNSGIKALEEALGRRKILGTVKLIENLPGFYSIRYKIIHPGKVSVIIPTKNKPELCEVIVESIFRLTDYPDFEIILVDNNSDEPVFFDFVKKWELKEPLRFKCIKDSGLFNFSRLMNNGVAHAKGDYLLLLNNDTEVLHADWMTAMVEQCQFTTTGAVGAKLMYPNNTIQHAGVIIGLGGIAGHTFVGYDRNASGYFHFLKSISNYSAVTAACVMVKKKDYEAVGGFDEALAVEFNDVDFCLKLKEKGWNNIYLPHVELYHYESISRGHPHKTKKSYQQHLHDVAFFKQRWQKYIDHDPCYSPHLTMIFTDFRLRMKD
jgi:O-antigen biosynthesis protein